jgi:hypothetical protein
MQADGLAKKIRTLKPRIRMSTNFKFESQLNVDLSCPPIAARQKLDTLGLKISRNQWSHSR